jgi:hypothetical protein
MKKVKYFAAVSAMVLVAPAAMAQTIDNNFSRDRGKSVLERSRAEYAPLGLRLGAFNANASVDSSLGYTDNLFYDDTRKDGDANLYLKPSVDLSSTWSRHGLAFGAASEVIRYSSRDTENTSGWNAYARGRLDVSSAASLSADISHDRSYESRSSFQASQNALKPVPVDVDRAALSGTFVGNRMRLIGTLSTSSESYGRVSADNGGFVDSSGRDVTTNVASARVDYAVSPSVAVFVYAESNDRAYDTNRNFDSKGSIISVGASFEVTGLSRGELQVGSLKQDYKSLSSGNQSTTYVNGKLEWFPTPLTSVTGKLSRNVNDTPNISGGSVSAIATSTSLGVDHELLRNLILSAEYKHFSYDFSGIDRSDAGDTLTLSGRYYMNRRVSLDAAIRHEKYNSSGSQSFRDYTSNWLRLGLTWRY